MDDFEGRVAVVTGAAGGIGAALAERLAREGMRLVLADVESGALEVVATSLRDRGHEVEAVLADVSARDQVEAVAAAALDRFGAVHLAVNNAGVAAGGVSWEMSEADWQWVLGVDLWGVIHGVSVFTPLIIEAGGGHVVNTASMAGLTSNPFMGPYNVAKHGVVTLSETMHLELQMLHPEVGVTVVCPGWVQTGINRSERNRPGHLPVDEQAPGGSDPMGAGGMRDLIDGLIASGHRPESVADAIVEAVRTRRFAVLTHPGWASAVTRRAERLVAGEPPELVLPTD